MIVNPDSDDTVLTPCPPTALEGEVKISRWGKLTWIPHETLIAGLLIIAGVRYFFSPEEVALIPPPIAVQTVGTIYLVSGICMILGLWRGGYTSRFWRGVELLGHGLIAVGSVTWFLVAIGYGSSSAFEEGLVSLLVVWASAVRSKDIICGRMVVRVDQGPVLWTNDGIKECP